MSLLVDTAMTSLATFFGLFDGQFEASNEECCVLKYNHIPSMKMICSISNLGYNSSFTYVDALILLASLLGLLAKIKV